MDTPKRDTLWAVQTPQVFERALYRKLWIQPENSRLITRMIVSSSKGLGFLVHLCLGDYHNLKLTTPEDIVLAEAILQGLQKKREENP